MAEKKKYKQGPQYDKAPTIKPLKSKTHTTNTGDNFTKVLLFFIAAGIWGIFAQNMGLIPLPNDDYTQKVRVVNTVDVNGSVSVDGGSVRVSGGYVTTEVDGTVDVNLEAINGHYNAFYNHNRHDDTYYRIPVYTYD